MTTRPFSLNLLQAARAAGAAAAEVYVERSSLRVLQEGREGRRRDPPVAETRVHLRVWDRRGGLGLARSRSEDPTALDGLVASAMAAAAQAPPDPQAGPADRYDVELRGLGIADRRQPQLDDEARLEVLRENQVDLGKEVEALQLRLEEQVLRREHHSSNGLALAEDSTLFRLRLRVQDRQSGELLDDELESRHFSDVANVPLGSILARRLRQRRQVLAPPRLGCALLLEPGALSQLIPALMPAFDARAIARGESFLAGREGQAIASPRVHLIDDATLPGGPRTRAFDDRGVPPLPLTLLREGVVAGMHIGLQRARSMGLRPSGHETVDGPPRWGNLVLRAGSRTRNMLLPDLGEHLAVEGFTALDGLDLRAGTLDAPVRLWVMKGPEIQGATGPARLRCRIEDLLRAVVELCNDPERTRETDACTWILDGITPTFG